MVSKPDLDIIEKFKHRHPRFIRTGEELDAAALERGEQVLQEARPVEEVPDEEQVEPWNWSEDKPMTSRVAEAFRRYREVFPDRSGDA